MINPNVQKAIKKSYQNLQHQLDNFVPRRAQNYLVAEIAKTLSGEYHKSQRMIVAEAGTGIGKSLSYLMAAIPVAMQNNRKVVISTATVALQEQLIAKDLPLFKRISESDCQFVLAKGRHRYCCREKLAQANGMDAAQIAMFEQKPSAQTGELLKELYDALSRGKWDGERDSWPTPIDDNIWQTIVSDRMTCSASFPAHRDCPFHQARSRIDKCDVIIANHSLVMADAALGGGVILPEPENTIYVFDEAHHLPTVAREHSAAAASVKGSMSWLERYNKALDKLCGLAEEKRVYRYKDTVRECIQDIIPSLSELQRVLIGFEYTEGTNRFENGELPEWFENKSLELKNSTQKLAQASGKIADLIGERLRQGEIGKHLGEPALAEIGFFLQRVDNLHAVWLLMAEKHETSSAPLARWIEQVPDQNDDHMVHVSPIEIGWELDRQIWSRCVGAVLVSATMRALNSFTSFCIQSGISTKPEDGTQFLALASPFDYPGRATLVVPKMKHEPQHPDFNDLLVETIPDLIKENSGNLVLFSSYWQMNKVAEQLEKLFKNKTWGLQVQGNKSREEILATHKSILQFGKTSVLFGTGSFSEGLDLPGKLLENLIITKLPFSVPTSPIEQAHAEYVEQRGGNPFMHISVPEASKKLIQSVGRLMRKEQDSGTVYILDRRLVSKRYGKALLDSLPPFKREIHY